MAKRLMYKKHASIIVSLLLVTSLLSISLTGISKAEPGYAGTILWGACRESTYGIDPFPNENEWERDIKSMAGYWRGSTPVAVWIVGIMTAGWDNMILQFPEPDGGPYENIIFDNVDRHENYLAYFDTHGIKVWLQVEPAFADMCTLIDLVLNQYGNHSCVVGFGVDVEWHKYTPENSFGPADKNWWNRLDNPPKDIGDALDEAIPNDMGIIWVDFTLRDVFSPPGEDTTPPVISDIATSDITGNSATITWTTDEISDGVVNYGENTSLGSSESDTGMFVEHIVTLTELSASTTYYYEVKSEDWDGNSTVDDNNGSYYTFTTTESDNTPPVIENVATSNITSDSATITWDTDEASDSVVNYGENTALGSSESDAAMVTSHSITLTNLSESTAYYYEVKSTDASSNYTVDDNNGSYYTFTTAAPDTTPPVIENVDNSGITSNSATITWDTDEIADSLVKYGTSSENYTENKYNSDDVTSHSIGLTSLAENTTYYYVVKSTDPSNNSSESSEYSFTTLEAGAQVMHVVDITMYLSTKGSKTHALASVTVHDTIGVGVPDAMVYGHWEGDCPYKESSALTDANGVAPKYNIQSDKLTNPPSGTTFIFVVDNITKDGWTYDPEANVETSDNIMVP